jgi:DNA-binding Lrp family transcriptional regulator
MIRGFVMVQCKTGFEQNAYKKLKGFKWVDEVHPLFGEFDFIMRVSAEDPNNLARYIIEDVRAIEGIIDTKTFLEASFGPESLKTQE